MDRIRPLGVLMVDIEGVSLNSSEIALLQRRSIGGLILFSRNYESPEQLRDLIGSLRTLRNDLLIAVDQEGGRVQRFRDKFLSLPSLGEIGKVYEENTNKGIKFATLCGWAMAAELLYYGIDLSFAPVLDLQNVGSRVIGDRAFSANPTAVINLAKAYIQGMNSAGMRACGKHYPGHGTVEADSHTELPVDGRPAESILSNDFRIFAELKEHLDGVMPAHVIYPAIDDHSAGYSEVWIKDKLRQGLKFEGVVFSDDLSMEAAKKISSSKERAKMALNAGCDMILVCNDRVSALEISDWLESKSYCQSDRITRMRSVPTEGIKNLFKRRKWISAVETINSFALN